jgi:hypothetical protein
MALKSETPRSRDAVIVVPGIMGTELLDADSGQMLWGLDLGSYVEAWTTGAALQRLAVTPAELTGSRTRIRPGRLLRSPAWAPFLRGIEPYLALTAALRRVVANPDAVLEFGYDWRLSIEHNAGKLAAAADRHLSQWRTHPDGSAQARLVIVAHSMGGLVANYFTAILGGGSAVRTIITLGTPFYGSVKGAVILNAGLGAPIPLPAKHLRELARTMRGLYDLLPFYRCVDEGTSARLLAPGDVADLGGDRALAAASTSRHARLLRANSSNIRSLVGIGQPTMQSLVLHNGVARSLNYVCLEDGAGGLRRENRGGDGTVYRDAALRPGISGMNLAQSHGALAKTEEIIAHVCAALTERELGPPLGRTELGLDLPELAAAGERVELRVTSLADPIAAACRVTDAATRSCRVRGASVAYQPVPEPRVPRPAGRHRSDGDRFHRGVRGAPFRRPPGVGSARRV